MLELTMLKERPPTKTAKFLAAHYPATNPPPDGALQALIDSQQPLLRKKPKTPQTANP